MSSPVSRPSDKLDPVKHATYLPFLLFGIANGLSRSASQFYSQRFDVGVTEWRILSSLAEHPGASANDICKLADMDKAAASRSLKVLKLAGYILDAEDDRDGRRRILSMTPDGERLHGAMRLEALKREVKMTDGLSVAEVEALVGLLQRIRQNVHDMGASG